MALLCLSKCRIAHSVKTEYKRCQSFSSKLVSNILVIMSLNIETSKQTYLMSSWNLYLQMHWFAAWWCSGQHEGPGFKSNLSEWILFSAFSIQMHLQPGSKGKQESIELKNLNVRNVVFRFLFCLYWTLSLCWKWAQAWRLHSQQESRHLGQ